MAQTYENNTTVLSKVKIGSTVYYIKDAAARKILDSFGSAATKSVASSVAANGNDLPTAGAVHTAIQNAITGLSGAMHFRGIVEKTSDITNPASGDVIIISNKEYVYNGATWAELGDEGLYVTKATYDAMVESLGTLAKKNSASGTLTDYVNGITGASYTPAGSVSVSISNANTEITSTGSYTPTGSISLAYATKNGTVATGKVASTGSYTPAGSISTPTITVTPNTTNVYSITGVGTLPSCTLPTIASKPTATFATSGITASMDSSDGEMLVLEAASTDSAITNVTLNAGSFSAGTLPTKGAATSVVTSIKSATATKLTFAGTPSNIDVSGNLDVTDLTASFTGTKETVSVSGTYSKATGANGSFNGTAVTITPTLKTGNKTVSVS